MNFHNLSSFERARRAESNAPTHTAMASIMTELWFIKKLNFSKFKKIFFCFIDGGLHVWD